MRNDIPVTGGPRATNRLGVEADEPTWEVRSPERSGERRFDGRARSILTLAAVIVVVVNAGVVWVYWRITGADTSRDKPGAAVELTLRGRSDFNRPLEPGGTGKLIVTVTNDHNFPIRITAVRAAAGKVVADDEHRDAGCKTPVVSLASHSFRVKWDVERNRVGAFTIHNGLTMAPGAHPSCLGATYTIPIQVTGYSQS